MTQTSIPHLKTALSGALYKLEQHILDHSNDIETWFEQQWQQNPAPIYSSIDLRHAGFKLAPIDTNLFPAGFNNLNPDLMPLCITACQQAVQAKAPHARKILLIPENHTRNTYYLENIAQLYEIINQAGFEVRIGSLQTELTTVQSIDLASGRQIHLHPLLRTKQQLQSTDFIPDLIWLNNDLSAGTPKILQQITQPIVPPIHAGWQQRSKAIHFQYYQKLSHELAALINIDPWLIDPYFEICDHVDFMSREGEKCLMRYTQKLLDRIQKKYDQYNLRQQPYVIIKADAGTYGMAVMQVTSVADIQQLNRKQRTRMATSKGRQTVTRVLIQEGIPTIERWQQSTAEPVVYVMGQHIIGGFYRMHAERSATASLNTPGMRFAPFTLMNADQKLKQQNTLDNTPDRFYAYSVIARLAVLAATSELTLHPSQEHKAHD